MKLYTFPFAPNPARVEFYLREKDIEIETILIDLSKGEHKTESHLRRHPGGAVPVLELDDGRYLTESLAIIEYLEELHPTPPMIGATTEERAFTRSMERFVELQLFSRLLRYVHATNSPIGLPANPALAENEERFLPDALGRLDIQIGGSPFVMGDRPSIADVTLLGGLRFATFFGWELPGEHRNLHRWFESYGARHPA